ncbi:chitooligosaccharidolytic beta-N-acetylglucosaminidase-like [Artemia franciscana]|uniref:Beta-hexosaminidase n=1 Tax=Artemia franciscana TaxID=6661 RepID=A0AA88I6B9_ARTSF|nr:hypothetical protein QYM36_001410 [Artemia franciscana]
MKILITFLCCLLVTNAKNFFRLSSTYNWKCESQSDGKTCVRYDSFTSPGGMTLAACKLTCRDDGALWPLPTGDFQLANTYVEVVKESFIFDAVTAPTPGGKTILDEMVPIFRGYLDMMENYNEGLGTHSQGTSGSDTKCNEESYTTPSFKLQRHIVSIDVVVTTEENTLTSETNESYTLSLETNGDKSVVAIVAPTVYGARHGLETLSQLIIYDPEVSAFLVTTQALINDSPVYSHRGLSMDTSRNYLPLPALKRIIDGLSYNKLNVFHWHITDTNAYPLVSSRVPQLTLYGAYTSSHVYSPDDIRELVRYAQARGVRVLPEFDAPSHVGNGWQWGPNYNLGNMVLCANKEPWQKYCVQPPCGQLNPVNENMYRILEEVYKDFNDVFDSDIFHMGGDEVLMVCWNETQEIINWLEENGKNRTQDDFLDLWDYFQKRALGLLDSVTGEQKPVVLWTSDLTAENHVEKYLDKNRYIIQVWDSSKESNISTHLYNKGYRIIMSNYDGLYLDCGFSGWVGAGNNWCSPYKGWQLMYDNDPVKIIEQGGTTVTNRSLILGGEAALWSEQVDEATVMGKLFPRLASVAERYWTDPKTTWKEAEIRFVHNRQRLVGRKIQADAVQPLWCYQNERLCYS